VVVFTVIFFRFLHPENAFAPIVATFLPIVTLVIFFLPFRAFALTEVMRYAVLLIFTEAAIDTFFTFLSARPAKAAVFFAVFVI